MLLNLKHRKNIITAFAVLIMLALKLSYEIYPFLDDYIQFKGYSMYPSPLKDTYIDMGLFSARPLAGLLDTLFYSNFFENLYIPYFIITLMHFSSIFMMRYNLKKIGIFCGWGFIILCIFNPILPEAVYWLSASSRVIPPFFFAQLAVLIICNERFKNVFLKTFMFWLAHLISLGFYEQIALFSVFWSILFSIKKHKKTEMYICILNAGVFLLYYAVFKNAGIFSARGDLGFGGLLNLFTQISTSIGKAVKCGFFSFFSQIPGVFTIITAAVCILCLKAKSIAFQPQKLYLAGILFIITFLPFAVLKNYIISFRSLFLLCIAFALAADSIAGLIKIPQLMFSAICIFTIFSYSNEMTDYKKVYTADKAIIAEISNNLSASQKKSQDIKLCLIGAKKSCVPIKVLYGEHILNVTSSDWAITGALRAEFENIRFPYVTLDDNPDANKFDVIINLEKINKNFSVK